MVDWKPYYFLVKSSYLVRRGVGVRGLVLGWFAGISLNLSRDHIGGKYTLGFNWRDSGNAL